MPGLRTAGLQFQRQQALPVRYKEIVLDCGYRMDLLVQGEVVVELKTVEKLMPVHEAQVLTYMRLGGYPIGLLLNFHSAVLKNGLRRFSHS